MNIPKVSVLIPLYNCELYIDEAINSVLSQTFQDFELIIVDNCSTDNSFNIIQKYAADSRVRIYQNDTNIGMARNWNQCMLLARGEYIKFLCADDYFEIKEMLSDYVTVMDESPDVSFVFAPKILSSQSGITHKPLPYFVGKRNGSEILEEVIKNHLNPFGEPSSVMFRRKHINAGFFNYDYNWATDIDYWLRLCALGNVFGLSKHYAVFRINDAQCTQQMRNSGRFLQEEKEFIHYNFFTRISSLKGNRRLYQRAQRKQLFNNISWGTINYSQAISYLDVFPLYQSFFLSIYISAFYTGRYLKRRFFK